MWHVVILIHTRDELVSSRLKPSPSHTLRARVTGHHSSSPATQSQTGVWNGCRCYQFCQSWQPLQRFNAAQMVCWCMSPFVTEIEEWQGLCPYEETEFQLVTNYRMFEAKCISLLQYTIPCRITGRNESDIMRKNPHNNNINKHNELHLLSNDVFCSESIVDLVPLHIKVVLVFWLVNFYLCSIFNSLWITKFPFSYRWIFIMSRYLNSTSAHPRIFQFCFLLRKDSLDRQTVSTRHVGGEDHF